MGWFGFGGDSGSGSDGVNKAKSYDAPSFPGDDSLTSGGFSSGNSSLGGSAGGMPSAPGGQQLDAFQQEVLQLQQSNMAQAVVTKLTELAFTNCISKPGSSLSSSERSCIKAQVGKYIESSEFVVRGLSGQ